MFTALSEQLTGVLNRLRGRGVLSESDVTDALREIRRHLLEADVSFEVTRGFVERVRERAVGALQVKAVSPGQQIVKLVHDEIATLLGGTKAGLEFASVGPTVILLVGLQGSGKTTTAAKLARRLKLEQKAPALVAADIYRPAAAEQLRQLGEQIGVPVFGGEVGDVRARHGVPVHVPEIVRNALREAESARARTVIVDTAGRLQIDAAMMDELRALKAAVLPQEVLLVADGMTGQDAVKIARGFHEGVGLTGVILTKLDGDARGGAALSIHGVTGVPIKYVGVGEKTDALEPFDPGRMAGRILGQGDVVALVEKAVATVDAEAAKRLEQKVKSKRGMDLQDFLVALKQMQSMGPLQQVLGLLPGINAKALQGVSMDDKRLKHVEAIVLSMTPEERADPSVLSGPRRLRIAKGSGRSVQEVNRLLEQFQQMRKLSKFMKRM
ncbi:MAG TPA: signal recognition particle protein [Gemmatimonadales bacterium]|jgi:signal recognition particle subunit SRP54|nr:signal recognition particle protein [Gemmatimonadales bacterium]